MSESEMPATAEGADHPEGRRATRAAIACKECNRRKTKCDVESQQPAACTKCLLNNRKCELVDSRRGRYDRTHLKKAYILNRQPAANASNTTTEMPTSEGNVIDIPHTLHQLPATFPSSLAQYLTSPGRQSQPHGSPDDGSATRESQSASEMSNARSFSPSTSLLMTASDTTSTSLGDAQQTGETGSSLPIPSSVQSVHESLPPDREEEQVEDNPHAWTDLMQLDNVDIETTHGAHDVTYASDLFTLSHILRRRFDESALSSHREHFPGMGVSSSSKNYAPSSASATKHSLAEIQYLTDTGCFTLPPKQVLDHLIGAYFEFFHPMYPVLVKSTFMHDYAGVLSGAVPLLLLWGMLHVSCTLCNIDDIKQAGFSTRFEALRSFCVRGKALYNANWERSKVISTLFEFHISQVFSESEDAYVWAARASCSALSLGMHKSTANSMIAVQDQRYWRRIWWAVYIRDRHSAAGTGRPYRIVDDFVDVEMPERNDFETQEDFEFFTASINLAKLLTQVVNVRLASSKEYKVLQKAACYQSLLEWQRDLPPRLSAGNTSNDLAANFLHLGFHGWVIHLFRQTAGQAPSPATVASQSAATATHLCEDLLAKGKVGQIPQFGATALFATMAQHLHDRKSSNSTLRTLSDHRLAITGLAVKELSKMRPVASWFHRMFKSFENNTPPNERVSNAWSQQARQSAPLNSNTSTNAGVSNGLGPGFSRPDHSARAGFESMDIPADWKFEYSDWLLNDVFTSAVSNQQMDDSAFDWLQDGVLT